MYASCPGSGQLSNGRRDFVLVTAASLYLEWKLEHSRCSVYLCRKKMHVARCLAEAPENKLMGSTDVEEKRLGFWLKLERWVKMLW